MISIFLGLRGRLSSWDALEIEWGKEGMAKQTFNECSVPIDMKDTNQLNQTRLYHTSPPYPTTTAKKKYVSPMHSKVDENHCEGRIPTVI